MDYLNFTVEDFLCDDSFLKYCLGTSFEAVDFWEKWFNDHPEKTKDADIARDLFYKLNGNLKIDDFQKDYQIFKNALALKLKVL